MKRFFGFFMIFLSFLTACSSSGSSAECKEGICVSIEVEGPVQALVPARFIISVKTDNDISALPIGLSVFPGITVLDIEKIPDSAKLIYQDKTNLSWYINTRSDKKYSFSGHIILSQPTVSYGIFHYTLLAFFSQPDFGRVTDTIMIYLDSSGKQVDESIALKELQNRQLAPTSPPDLTIVPEATNLIDVWPSITPSPSPTPTITLPAYPNP